MTFTDLYLFNWSLETLHNFLMSIVDATDSLLQLLSYEVQSKLR